MSRRRRLAALLLAAALLLTGCAAAAPAPAPAPAAGTLELHVFDAGAADAILLRTENSAVLIDAGEKGFGKTILAYLAEQGVDALDYLIVTHFDKDHVGGAAKVLNSIPVKAVLQSNQPKDSDEYENYVEALRGAGIEPVTLRETDTFSLDGVSYTVDPPRQSAYAQDSSNNSSLIVSVRYGDTGILLPGDAQTLRLAEFLDANTETYDVLKLPHHGRDEPLLEALLASVKPTYAIITSSEEEPESGAVLAALEQAGVRTLLTRNQSVTLYSDGITIKQKE
ncbi:MAG: MBL fold metallo-hydrolase [Oscillospiraceae bacterium]|nr:MBL fold metallo-hydrolase [Oscillospiraceae bacterium]